MKRFGLILALFALFTGASWESKAHAAVPPGCFANADTPVNNGYIGLKGEIECFHGFTECSSHHLQVLGAFWFEVNATSNSCDGGFKANTWYGFPGSLAYYGCSWYRDRFWTQIDTGSGSYYQDTYSPRILICHTPPVAPA